MQAFLDKCAAGSIDEAVEQYCENTQIIPPEFEAYIENAAAVGAMSGSFDENEEDVVVWSFIETADPKDVHNFNITVSSDGKIKEIIFVAY